jgi:hypothetical protein
VANLLDRLKTALADRYAIEQEVGAGCLTTLSIVPPTTRASRSSENAHYSS